MIKRWVMRHSYGCRDIQCSSCRTYLQGNHYLTTWSRWIIIEVLDLLPAFRRQGSSVRLHLPRNTHWNARGNEVAAETILAGFLERSAEPQ